MAVTLLSWSTLSEIRCIDRLSAYHVYDSQALQPSLLIFGTTGQGPGGRGSSFRTFGSVFISVERMQLQSSNFVHKCVTGGYYPRIKNCAGMRLVSQNIKFRKIHSRLHNALSTENVKQYFRDTSYNSWPMV